MDSFRQQEFEEEYIHSRPEPIRVNWQSYDKDVTEFSLWLASFLSFFDEFIAIEVNNLSTLFGRDRMPRILSSMIESTMAPLAASMSERVMSSESPASALETFNNVNEFAKSVVTVLESSDSHQIFCVLSAIFGGYVVYMDAYPDIEAEYLRRICSGVVSQVTFEESDSLFHDAATKGASSSTSFLDGSDPVTVCMGFGEKLVESVEAANSPFTQSLRRIVRFMGGLKVKPASRCVAAALSTCIQQLMGKLEELRIATGHPPEKSSVLKSSALSTSISNANLSTDESSHSVAHAQSWSRKLENSDLGGRELIPAALRALQSAGRLSKLVRELESLALDLFAELTPLLFKDGGSDRYYRGVPSSPSPLLPVAGNAQGQSSNICTLFAYQLLQNNPSALLELKSFLSSATSHHVAQSAFASVVSPLSKYKLSCGAFLFDLCCSAPEKLLSDLKSEEIWASTKTVTSIDSLLPQHIFTQVGEHLLSLVQEFELFANSDTLKDLLYLSGETSLLTPGSIGWKKLREFVEAVKEDDGIEQLCKRSSCSSTVATIERSLFGSVISATDEIGDVNDAKSPKLRGGNNIESITLNGGTLSVEDEEAAQLWFVNDWLGAIADATTGIIVYQLISIPVLSVTGCQQMQVDIGYLR
jgi:hypothetical protein